MSVLRIKDGEEWTPIASITSELTDEQIRFAVDSWLDEHPEATTTVEDGAITYAKLNDSLKAYVTPEVFGAKGDGVTDDTQALSSALNQGLPCRLLGKYLINNALTTDAPMIYGNGEIIAGGGIEYMITASDNIVIDGIKFDSNNTGRGCVRIANTDFAIVKNCQFTGYSAESGYSATDSLLILNGVTSSFVDDCQFYDSGYDYGTASETLNRCITHQASLDKPAGKCFVSNCTFNHVDQAIVSTGSISVDNCGFKEVADNCFYLFGDALLCNCEIVGDDEGAVIKGGNYQIDNCYFQTGSVSINVNGNTESLLVSNCRFDNNSHAIFSSRDNSYTIGNCRFDNCYFGMSGTLTSGYGSPIACVNTATKYNFSNCTFDYGTVTNVIYNVSGVVVIASNCIFKVTTATRLINNNQTAVFAFCDTDGVSLSVDLRTGIFTADPNQDASYQSKCVVVKTTRVLLVNFSIKAGISTSSDCYVGLPKISSQQQVTTAMGNVFNYKTSGAIRIVTYTAPEDITAVIGW